MSAQPSGHRGQVWIGRYIGNYRLVRLLGEGSMGMVFEGVHEGVGGRAAIKLLRPEVTSREDIAARFFNEARAANASQHPGIVRIFDSGYTPEGVAFLSMEYLDGQSLRARLTDIKKLPVRDALRVGRQIASALLAAHRKNIIHRDLKPDNVPTAANFRQAFPGRAGDAGRLAAPDGRAEPTAVPRQRLRRRGTDPTRGDFLRHLGGAAQHLGQ